MADPVLYAQTGEEIVCEAGHVVTRPTRDIYVDEALHGDMLDGFAHLRSADLANGIEGDAFPHCTCGERWSWFGTLRFREGYRTVEYGVRTHMTLAEVVQDDPSGCADRVARGFWA